MKKPSFSAAVAMIACLCLATSLAFAQAPTRKAFGKGSPFTVEELPAGKLKSQLSTLTPQAMEKAMKWLHTLDFGAVDAAEHLRVDKDGGIFIVCPDSHGNCEGHSHGSTQPECTNDSSSATGNIAPEPGQTTEPPVAYAAVPVSAPPAYSSKPGATRHIYLDFNGGIVSGTAWSTTTYNVKVWSQDADRTTFNDAEQAWMRRVWERVSEDYAPFDVNVTTDVAYDPDNYTGNKDLVGWLLICETIDNNGVALPHDGSGGIAYVGVFGNSTYSPTYQPAWVTSTNGGGNEAIIAEAASHEMGHNMGLSHDDTTTLAYYGGHVATASAPSWGPIMGTGYDRNVSQWSKGEYYGANQLEDDLVIMSGRVPYRTDDHGNSFAGATGCVATNNTISQSGIIERTNDPDVFSFTTGAGPISFTANPYRCDADTWGGNLDIILELYDSSQTLIASNNPAALTTASISTTVAAAGTYYLVLKPSAAGTPLVSSPSGYTVYGSLGQYTISGTVQPFDPPLGLTGISPSSGNEGSTVTVDISGTKLSSNTAVKLKKTGRADIPGTSVQMIGSTLRCQFNLTGAASGAWNVVATNPDLATSTLSGTFTVNGTLVPIWSENFDGTVTGWTSQAISGTANSWSLVTTASQSPNKSYFAAGPLTTSVTHLISPQIPVPADSSNQQIEFWHRYSLQSGRDGGRLSFSLDGGAWFDVTSSTSGAALTLNGYNTAMATTGQTGPFAGLQAWSGTTSNAFVKTTINLTDLPKYAGKNLRLRWEIATNNQTASAGWYVDSVSLLSDYTPPNQSPIITVAASTSSSETQTVGPTTYQIIRGTSTSLAVTATDDAGESNLTYTWQSTGPASVVFPVNGNNAAKNTTATFSTIGDYVFTVTTKDTGDLSTTSSVNVRVLSTDSYAVTPSTGNLTAGSTLQFSAAARDQFGTLLVSQPSPVNWSANGGGSINSSGLFTATTAGGPFIITATSGVSYSANAQVTVNPASGGGDTTPPTLAGSSIVDDKSGGPVTVNTLITYTLTFSEDMDASTITTADFGNAGSAAVTIGAVTETLPGIFTVQATPTTAGPLQLKINAAAILKDVAGNNLNTGSAILDDTTLTIDGTAPTLASIADDKSSAPITVNTLVTYTVTFSEDMDASTVTTADFGNAGSAAVTIGAVTETLPGIFTVQATPTTAGTLQLKINAAAILKDVAGNNLNTGSPILDDTTLTIDGTAPTLASIADDKSGGPVPENTLVSYTVTFNEDMDASTVDATDFGNAGSAAITIGAVTETVPGVFTVQATPTSAGTLQLQIPVSAELKDLAGNHLDTTSAILDDTIIAIITVDGTPPTLANITDDKSGGPVAVNTSVTYTVTFSEDMDASTVDAADFGNAGTAAVTIGSVTETSPGVFTMQATPTSAGTLQLQIPVSAGLKDVAGNNLNTTSALADDTIITVNTTFDSWTGGTFANGTLSDKNAALDFDGGGLPTGIEWVVGGDPTTGDDDTAKAPTCDITTDPAYLTYTYRRSDAANTDVNTTIIVEYGSDLSGWTSAVAGPDIVITESDNFYGTDPGIDKVEVKIQRSPANNRLFTRLNVAIAP